MLDRKDISGRMICIGLALLVMELSLGSALAQVSPGGTGGVGPGGGAGSGGDLSTVSAAPSDTGAASNSQAAAPRGASTTEGVSQGRSEVRPAVVGPEVIGTTGEQENPGTGEQQPASSSRKNGIPSVGGHNAFIQRLQTAGATEPVVAAVASGEIPAPVVEAIKRDLKRLRSNELTVPRANADKVRAEMKERIETRLTLVGLANGEVDPDVLRSVDPTIDLRKLRHAASGKLSEPILQKLVQVLPSKLRGHPAIKTIQPGVPDPDGFLNESPKLGRQPAPIDEYPRRTGIPSLTAKGRRAILFDPMGFREVVLIADRGSSVCTGTLVQSHWVVTAAHCVTKKDSTKKKDKVKARLAVYVGYENGTDCIYRRGEPHSRGSAINCHLKKFKLKDIQVMHGYVPRIANDIALIQLNHDTRGISPAKLYGGLEPRKITMAGYGYTTLPGDEAGRALEVGWRSGVLTLSQGRLIWMYMTGDNESSTCYGDSGGPIFAGDQFGYRQERHALYAVISVLAVTQSQARSTHFKAGEACLHAYSQETLVSTARGWICEKIGTNSAACGGGT